MFFQFKNTEPSPPFRSVYAFYFHHRVKILYFASSTNSSSFILVNFVEKFKIVYDNFDKNQDFEFEVIVYALLNFT